MQLLYHDFRLFCKQSLRWGQQGAAKGEHCANASSVTPGLHLALGACLLLQGWRCSCPLKPRGEQGAGLLVSPDRGTSCVHGRGFLAALLCRVRLDTTLRLSPLNNKAVNLFPFSL